ACHKMDERYVGPALGDVTERRAPAYIMNMMLNPEEMIQKHPEVKALLAQYLTPMPNQQLTEADARAVLEYLRDENEDQD
ncbi:MAG: c-type cytochrome, partial [Rhodothermales bacterium]